METKTQISGALLILVGAALRYWINRRRFNRRNMAGVQIFKSFEHLNIILFLERLVKIIGFLIMTGGVAICLLSVVSK